jgi:hypothetical protein
MNPFPQGPPGRVGPPGPPSSGAYAEEVITSNATPMTLTLQNTWYPIGVGWSHDQSPVGMTVDDTTGHITSETAGEFATLVAIEGVSPTAAVQGITFGLFKNGVLIPDHVAKTWVQLNVYPLKVSISGLDAFVPGDVIDLRVQCTSEAGLVLTVTDVNLSLFSVSAGSPYAPAVPANWSGTAPTTVQDALDRIAAKIGPIA